MSEAVQTYEHPAFVRAKSLSPFWQERFPKCVAEVDRFQPFIRWSALSSRVLAVATTRIECKWSAYIDAVPGQDHDVEIYTVLNQGTKLDEAIARILFPIFNDIPYAR